MARKFKTGDKVSYKSLSGEICFGKFHCYTLDGYVCIDIGYFIYGRESELTLIK